MHSNVLFSCVVAYPGIRATQVNSNNRSQKKKYSKCKAGKEIRFLNDESRSGPSGFAVFFDQVCFDLLVSNKTAKTLTCCPRLSISFLFLFFGFSFSFENIIDFK